MAAFSTAMKRTEIVEKVRDTVAKAGFILSNPSEIYGISFDFIARNDDTLIVVKVLKNVDSLSKESANGLKVFSNVLDASPIVIGERSISRTLDDGVLYMRYGISIMNPGTLEDYLLEGLPPLVYSSPGGCYVHLDGKTLRTLRERHGLSLGGMADIAKVSKRTIQMYEEGMSASVETACLLEDFFDVPLVKPLEVLVKRFEMEFMTDPDNEPTPLEKEIFRDFVSMGYDVFPISHFPFSAFSQQVDRKRNIIMTGVEKDDRVLKKKARMVTNLSEVTGKRSVFIVKKTLRKECVEGMPIIERRELKKVSGAGELLELIIERAYGED